jgi:hypothetical protein
MPNLPPSLPLCPFIPFSQISSPYAQLLFLLSPYANLITFCGVPTHFIYTMVFWTTLKPYLTCNQGT